MIDVFHKHFMIRVHSFINQQGNTSYILDVFDYSLSGGGLLAYRLIRYQYLDGKSNYYMCADSDGACYPCAVRLKDLLPGFNWSCVRRAIHDELLFRRTWFF